MNLSGTPGGGRHAFCRARSNRLNWRQASRRKSLGVRMKNRDPRRHATSSRPDAAVSGSAESGADYIGSDTHYVAVAGRIASALRENPLVIVTGDPPPDPDRLLQVLRTMADGRYTVVRVSGGSGTSVDEVFRAASAPGTPEPDGGPAAVAGAVQAALPIVVLNDSDALTGPQISQICKAARDGAPGVLLARTASPEWLKDAPGAPVDFAEIGQEEAIDFLRHRLASRHLHQEKRGVPPFALRGLAGVGGLVAAAIFGIGLFQYLHSPGGPSAHPRASSENGASAGAGAPMALHAVPSEAVEQSEPVRPAANGAGVAALPERPPPRSTPPSTAPDGAPGSAPSPAEITILRARGDDFLKAGDIASARLFYERAAGAGDGAAALRLGATFDPGFLARAGVSGALGDPAQASSWYRRARDLGEAAAAERSKSLKQAPPDDRGAAPR